MITLPTPRVLVFTQQDLESFPGLGFGSGPGFGFGSGPGFGFGSGPGFGFGSGPGPGGLGYGLKPWGP